MAARTVSSRRLGGRRIAALLTGAAALAAVTAVPAGADAAGASVPTTVAASARAPRLDWHLSSVVAPVPAIPPHAVALGSLAKDAVIRMDVVLAPRHPAALAQLATAVSTPGSVLRGDYLSPAELRRAFSPTAAQLRSVEAGLSELGLTVEGASADRLTVHVRATAAAVARAMRVRLERYRLAGGRVAYANTSPARLPQPIGRAVVTVIGLSSVAVFRPLAIPAIPAGHVGASTASGAVTASTTSTPANTRTTSTTSTAPAPCGQLLTARRNYGGYTANELASAYRFSRLYAAGDFGSGVTVGVVEFERNAASDVKAYESCYGISTDVTYVKVDGGATGPRFGSGEAALDIEDVAGLAPRVHIVVYQAPNTNAAVLDELQWIVDHPVAKVVSDSWGECEEALGSSAAAARAAARAESTLFEYAAAEGQTWLAAAGDEGSTDCFGDNAVSSQVQESLTVDDPGSQPYMTSVGGTRLRIFLHRETVWNDVYGATGGGISSLWTMPAYQAATHLTLGVRSQYSSGAPCSAPAGYCREVPDVSADADPATAYLIFWSGAWQPIGGTSAAAPLWAAVVALSDASTWCGGRTVGFLNPVLYAIAGSKHYSADFTDITSGDNNLRLFGSNQTLYPATKAYDMASGLGSPIVDTSTGGLAPALCDYSKVVRPGIDWLSPASGPAGGANVVTITGYGFVGVTAVEFGSKRAISFKVLRSTALSPTTIRAVAPAGTGTVFVTVVTPSRDSPHTASSRYTYQG